MRSRGFDFGDFEITKREILASISIIAVMLLIGFTISGRISNYILDRNEKYNKAIKIESSDLFEYGMRTNVGYAFVYGDLKAVDTVSYPEINGEYMYIEKIEEHYNMHTRTVTTTDSKGKTHTRTETYWSWDYAGSEEQKCSEIIFLGHVFPSNKVEFPSTEYIDTIKNRAMSGISIMALARNILEPYLPNYEIKPYLIILHFTKIAPLTKLLIIWKAIGNYGYSGRFG